MATITENFDVQISVITPKVTKNLKKRDLDRLTATNNIKYTAQKSTDASSSPLINNQVYSVDDEVKSDADYLLDEFEDILGEIERIQSVVDKRSKDLYIEYNPYSAENEALAQAEETLFGYASGKITYEMYKQVIEYNERINKYLSQKSINSNGGVSLAA